MQRYFIQFSYNGKSYHGWQIQKNTSKTVQQILNECISTVLNEHVETIGCGRTDTGVHAKEYYAHFDSKKEDLIIDKIKWIYKFNAVLPADIAIRNIFKVNNEASARFDAVSRIYEYAITTKKDPFLIDKAYFYSHELNVGLMNKACKILFDYHDFSCFSKSNTQTFTNNCKIMHAEWVKKEDLLVFTIQANRFLRNMVRAIVGTMIDVGKEKITIEEFKKIIESKNRSDAGFSVPAGGLYLIDIEYPENYFDE